MSATGSPRQLGDLPDELLIRILKLLPSQRDISAMCLVNQRVHTLAVPFLYKSIFFDQPKHHMTFFTSLKNRPRRASFIQNVQLEYPGSTMVDMMYFKDKPNRIENFSYAISTMSNLKTLVISVPESLCHGIGTLFNGPFDLACLESCELHPKTTEGGITATVGY